MTKLKHLLAGAACAGLASVQPASAAFVLINPIDGTTFAQVVCALCVGVTGDQTDFSNPTFPVAGTAALDEDKATVFVVLPANETKEVSFLASLLTGSGVAALPGFVMPTDDFGTGGGGAGEQKFNVTQGFFSMKFGNFEGGGVGTAFFYSSGIEEITYKPNGVNGADLSNYTQFDGFVPGGGSSVENPVPLPAAAPLLLAGLAGIGFLARRRRAA